jgi:hypothetical protein
MSSVRGAGGRIRMETLHEFHLEGHKQVPRTKTIFGSA